MWTRALIVLLLVLNVGVAAWWATRAPAPAPAAPAAPIGIARLRLVGEAGATPPVAPMASASATAPTAKPVAAPDPDPTAVPPRCYRYGPFADAAAAAAARARLQPLVQRARAIVEPAPGRGWRVLVPPQPSLVDAQAMAQRLALEGFDDFLIVREGPEANAIALGRYGREDAARRRAQSLVDAGFAARAEPLGGADASHWLDVAAGPGFDDARARAAAGAGVRDVDCAGLR